MAKKLGTLRIKDREFKVTDAILSGKIRRSGPIEWFLEVDTERTLYEGVGWSPRAFIEQYPSDVHSIDELIANPIVVKNGAAFCGHTIMPGGRLCCLQVFDTEYLDHTRIVFERTSRNRLKITWTAKCAVYRGEEFGANLDLKIETLIDFIGFSLDVTAKQEASDLLAKKFEPSGLYFHIEPGREGSYYLPHPSKW